MRLLSALFPPHTKITIFPLKHSSTSLPNTQSIFNWDAHISGMNKRFIIVGIALGLVITLAVIIGSPAIGGFDSMR